MVTYSISCDPFPQIWAQTDYGFFRIVTPSPEFAPVLATMKQGVEIFTALMDLEEDFRSQKKSIRIPDIKFKVCLTFLTLSKDAFVHKLQLAITDGSGVTEKEILDHVKLQAHAPFIMSHLRHNKLEDWEIFSCLKSFLVSLHSRSCV